jgi:hypothetical protein
MLFAFLTQEAVDILFYFPTNAQHWIEDGDFEFVMAFVFIPCTKWITVFIELSV